MFLAVYTLFLLLFRLGINAAALFNEKAARWIKGRKNIFENISQTVRTGDKKIWMHCASLGEFEQGRPVLEQLKTSYPAYKIFLTFFSPSGYEVRKNYAGADYIFYLPLDSSANAKRFLDLIKPSLVIFVKYEFWYHYTYQIHQRNIPFVLISATFRDNQVFFKWYGKLYKKMLGHFSHFFVQDTKSKTLLSAIIAENKITVAGDTRFDRVIEIESQFQPIPFIKDFISNNKTIVAGSTWPDDERILCALNKQQKFSSVKLVIAPHEINKEHIDSLRVLFPSAIFWSELQNGHRPADSNILIIDTIGMLSRLYFYADISYIGGGFTKDGIHNSLEAAVYGKPVVFGPNYKKYREAIELIAAGGAKSFSTEDEFSLLIGELLTDTSTYHSMSVAAEKYVHANKGATGKVMNYIQEKRLLTN